MERERRERRGKGKARKRGEGGGSRGTGAAASGAPAEWERGAERSRSGAGAKPERSRSEAGAGSGPPPCAAVGGASAGLRGASFRGEGQGERGGRGRLVGEAGLSPERTVCACFGEGHRHEDGSNDLIFLFFPGTISAQIGRMK